MGQGMNTQRTAKNTWQATTTNADIASKAVKRRCISSAAIPVSVYTATAMSRSQKRSPKGSAAVANGPCGDILDETGAEILDENGAFIWDELGPCDHSV